MLEKSEVKDLIKNFCVMAEKQFEKQVKTIRTDNGTKFMVLSSYFLQQGIQHQTSCVDTPQQNARVERKHRHILNIARALLFQAKLPVTFWGESILTAAHLINRTPSAVLNGQTPYELLHGSKPSYDSLRTFGCLCYAQRRPRKARPVFSPTQTTGTVVRRVMGYIGAHGVAALHRYKYSGVDHSYLAKYLLNPFWTRFVKVFPLWMPPNMITLMGFMFLVTSSLLGYIYSPQLDSPPPRWVHFAHGLLLFLYQTFDAVDGKQARRTNSSSPLGELFDHGCDALACAFEAMAFGSTAMCGRDTFWFWVISAIPFYGATWEHYFTNTLILPVINGPTEGLALIYVSHLFTALVGAEWWAQQLGESIPLFSWVPFLNAIQTSRAVLYMMIAFAVIPTVAFNVSNVYKVVQSRKGSMVLALAMLYPFVVLLGGVLIWDYLSPINLIATYPHLVVLGTGLAFGFLVGRMILAHLCDEPKGLKTNMCLSLVYLPFALANALTARLNAGVPLVDELWVLLGYCIFTVSLYLHFATSVIHEITAALGIYCFRITKKLEKKP